MSSWPQLEAALVSRSPRSIAGSGARAAVALVFREGPRPPGLELLFIRRAEHAGDPWSGQVGFPGGRAEPADATSEDTARRETWEETGIDLAREGELVGALDDVQAMARGRPVDLVIAPRVFRLRGRVDGSPSHEVVSLHWLPVERLIAPETRSSFDYDHEGATLRLPCLRLEGLVIWGLTYRMFDGLAALLPRPPA